MLVDAAVSIVEKTRQYLKSAYGSERNIIPRSMSFCQFTFLTRLPVVLVVEDAQQDERCASCYLSLSLRCCSHRLRSDLALRSCAKGYCLCGPSEDAI